MAGIYIHIPFCRKHCFYCDFHFKVDKSVDNDIITAILRDLELQKDFMGTKNIDTLYFGGGTPSILAAEQLTAIFNKVHEIFTLKKAAEVTFEANPEDVNENNLTLWKNAGINRLSMGIQSFFEDDLLWMNRNHNAEQAIKAIELAKSHGFDKISIDLIFGFPILTHEKWKANVDKALELEISHISCYGLTVEHGTPLYKLIRTKKVEEPEEQLAVEQFDYLMDTLQAKGWEHYEISNFAKDGAYGIHNHNYWQMKPYLGIGPSAHGFNGTIRRANYANNKRYIKNINNGISHYLDEPLSFSDLYNDYILVSIRTQEGIQYSNIPSGTQEFWPNTLKNIEFFIDKEWIESKGAAYVLTQKGKHFADAITRELMNH